MQHSHAELSGSAAALPGLAGGLVSSSTWAEEAISLPQVEQGDWSLRPGGGPPPGRLGTQDPTGTGGDDIFPPSQTTK